MKSAQRSISAPIAESELILNTDKSVYHLGLKNENIADLVLVVGDQNRVRRVSLHFDRIDFRLENREFHTHTGTYNNKRITVLSTGIGADNVDIVVNELDAAVNIDPDTRMLRSFIRSLDIVRIGTSGSLQKEIPVDSYVVSDYGLGFDGVLNFYRPQFETDEESLLERFIQHTNWDPTYNHPYFVRADKTLRDQLTGKNVSNGITITANGFYGPQGRQLVLEPKDKNLNRLLSDFKSPQGIIANYEMETAALYGLSSMLGHRACTICAIIANREAGTYSADYKRTVDEMILYTLDRLTTGSE